MFKKISRQINKFFQKRNGFSFGSGIRGSHGFHESKKRRTKPVVKILAIIAGSFIVVGTSAFYVIIIKELPDISKLENLVLSQATVITDRQGNVLYKLFQENRKYIEFDRISNHMVNAIIAVEDKDFWNNEGIDYMGIVRAGLSYISKGSKQGASTITQQLLKNLLLMDENVVKRKLKERVLASDLNNLIKRQIEVQHPNISSQELKRKSKEKILELYLNYIFLGNNNYGIEAASQGYFGKSAKDLTILESAIIASMPKAPSRFEPYKNRNELMGELIVKDNNQKVELTGSLKTQILRTITNNIQKTNLRIRKDNESFIRFVRGITSFDVMHDGKRYNVSYIPGRKDISLTRMFEESYIDQEELKNAFLEGLDFEFKRSVVTITAPHFVFWVIELLKERYSEETLLKGGLVIKTSLDGEIQKMIEKTFEENKKNLTQYGANNSAMIYLDSKNGDVLAYVGSIDYNNYDIDGKFDIIQGKRQPGSSIKPLIYAYGLMNLNITIDTPIYDIPIKVGKDQPNNADGGFLGVMPLRKALGYSRNIPAVKMYFSVGEEKALKPFLKDLGISTLIDNHEYGYPLALGAGEVKMIDLANAYAHLSAMGKPAVIDPILEIRTTDGSLIHQKKVEIQKQVIPQGVAYLMRKILSELDNLPPTRVGNFNVPGLKYAGKSGTSDMKMGDGRQLPRDGRLATYTPSKVAIFWAGNTNGAPMNPNAYGGWINGNSRKIIFRNLLKEGKIKSENITPVEVKNISINKITGRIPSEDTPAEFIVNSIGYMYNLPSIIDNKISYVEIDTLCGGKRSELTPQNELKKGYVIMPSTFMPNNMDLNDISEYRRAASQYKPENSGNIQYSFTNIFISAPEEICKERSASLDMMNNNENITINIMRPSAEANITRNFSLRYNIKSKEKIRYVKIFLNDFELEEIGYNRNDITDIRNLTAFKEVKEGLNYITILAIDNLGGSTKKTIPVTIIGEDKNNPYLIKEKIIITQKPDNTYNVILLFGDDESGIKGGKILKNNELIHSFQKNVATFDVASLDTISYEVTDLSENTKQGNLTLSEFFTPSQE